jgi:hypothetical protein
MIFKIEFDIPIIFNNNSIYTFDNPKTNESINFIYLSKSRIDGIDIFELPPVNYTKGRIPDFQYNKIGIKSISIVSNLEEHATGQSQFLYNKNKIVEFLENHFKIDDYDLSEKDAYLSVIRDIKLKLLL